MILNFFTLSELCISLYLLLIFDSSYFYSKIGLAVYIDALVTVGLLIVLSDSAEFKLYVLIGTLSIFYELIFYCFCNLCISSNFNSCAYYSG